MIASLVDLETDVFYTICDTHFIQSLEEQTVQCNLTFADLFRISFTRAIVLRLMSVNDKEICIAI